MKKSPQKSGKVSVVGLARRAVADDKRVRKTEQKKRDLSFSDSFQNFQQMLGIGADNALTTSSYGFNPITRNRILCEWIHRGSWIGGIAIDVKAEDMTREGAEMKGEVTPEQAEKIEEALTTLHVWKSLKETIQWARLYGGAIAVMLIDGQNYATELRLDTIDKGGFKGLLVLDRWQVDPSLGDLVTEEGPDLGTPKFYTVNSGAPALRNKKIHHSRCIKQVGIDLPYQQRLMENLWGISVLERLYDRMVAFDSASTGAAQLIFKAWIRTYSIEDLRDIIGAGGKPYAALIQQVNLMRRMQSIEGMTLLDAKDKMEAMSPSAYSGLAEMILQFGQQISGALQIPLVRLFGQSPAGLNSSGDSDLRTYYDGIKKDQKAQLLVPVTKIIRATAMSEAIRLPEGFKVEFRPLWQLTDTEKAEIAQKDGETIARAEEAGLLSQSRAMKEMKQSSRITGRFSTITDEEINAAEESLPPAGENAMGALGGEALGVAAGSAKEGLAPDTEEPQAATPKKGKKPGKDAAGVVSTIKRLHDLNIAIETMKGATRTGPGWKVQMPAHYGYFSGTNGRDGQEVDVWVGPNMASETVFIIKQIVPATGAYDEDKCMLGYDTMDAALTDYFSGYTDAVGWKRVGGVAQMGMRDFKAWLGQKIAAV